MKAAFQSFWLPLLAMGLANIKLPSCLAEDLPDDPSPISLKLAHGTVKSYEAQKGDSYQSALTWTSDADGKEVVLKQSHGGAKNANPQWTLEAGFSTPEAVAMLRGNSWGSLEYWRYGKSEESWKLEAKAMLGSPSLGWRGVTFTGVDKFEARKRDSEPDRFEITKKSRGGDPVYRTVLKNGEVFVPPNTVVGPEEYEADRSKKTRSGTTAAPKAAEATAPAGARSSAAPSAPASGVTPTPGPAGHSSPPAPSSEPPSSTATSSPNVPIASTPWLGVTLGVAAAIGLLLLLLKMRK